MSLEKLSENIYFGVFKNNSMDINERLSKNRKYAQRSRDAKKKEFDTMKEKFNYQKNEITKLEYLYMLMSQKINYLKSENKFFYSISFNPSENTCTVIEDILKIEK